MANYKVLVKKRSAAYLMMRMYLASRRFVIKWYLYIAAVIVLISFAVIIWNCWFVIDRMGDVR